MTTWKIVGYAPRGVVEAALATLEAHPDWDPAIVVTGSEVAEERPDDWVLEAYTEGEPDEAVVGAVRSLFEGEVPELGAEPLPDTDWVVETQQRVQPIRAGRFHVHTPDHAALDGGGVIDFVIPAAQAFGTGQHATTAGCLAMLDAMERAGIAPENMADIGTGTGLLGFAARALWPQARIVLSDIDPVCVSVVADNAALNRIPFGQEPGEISMAVADGMQHPGLASRAPFDLLIANILAGPLIEMAQDFADAVLPGGQILLAGLLETQQDAVVAAYEAAGCTFVDRRIEGDWSIVWLRKRES